jgi:hypothetical protein
MNDALNYELGLLSFEGNSETKPSITKYTIINHIEEKELRVKRFLRENDRLPTAIERIDLLLDK